MIARHVTMRLKANSVPEFTRTLEKEVIPLLQKQKGFEDEITFLDPDKQEAVGISFWEKQENADAYNREGYPEVLKVLGKVLDGTPQVRNWDVCNSTSHEIAAAKAV